MSKGAEGNIKKGMEGMMERKGSVCTFRKKRKEDRMIDVENRGMGCNEKEMRRIQEWQLRERRNKRRGK